jgi:predicted NBD/HSP70 family sugar kinase
MKPFDLNREWNLKRIVELVRTHGPISRVEISEQLHIPQPTVTRAIEELLKEKIIKEVGLGQSTGGRRPILLTFNPACYYVVGVELGRTVVKIALTDIKGEFLSFRMKETSRNEKIQDVIRYVKDSVLQLLEELQIDRSLLLGVGVGVPGPLHEDEEGCISPPDFYGETEIPLQSILHESLDFPVIIDNDANVAALAEKWFGKGLGHQNFVYVFADAGVGSGIVVNGNLYRGLYGESGEIGHWTIDLFGERCTCGNYGCLETLVSISKMEESVRRQLRLAPKSERALYQVPVDAVSFPDIVDALKKNSPVARQAFDEAARYRSVGLSNVINFFAPELVIVGGRIVQADEEMPERLRVSTASRVFGIGGRKVTIVASELHEGVVLGAAALVINNTFAFSAIE